MKTSRVITRRQFLEWTAISTAAVAGLGGIAEAQIARPRPAAPGGTTKVPGKVPLVPKLIYAPPEYDRTLRPIRLLNRWRPEDRAFLLDQKRFHGHALTEGHYVVATLKNESEGAAFDAVADLYALVLSGKKGEAPRHVAKFERLASLRADVHPNRTHDFAFRIERSDAFRLEGAFLASTVFQTSYVARYWHPGYDHAPAGYVAGDRHFTRYAFDYTHEPTPLIKGRNVPARR